MALYQKRASNEECGNAKRGDQRGGGDCCAEPLELGCECGHGAHDEERDRKAEKRSQRYGGGKHFAQGASRHALLKTVAFGFFRKKGDREKGQGRGDEACRFARARKNAPARECRDAYRASCQHDNGARVQSCKRVEPCHDEGDGEKARQNQPADMEGGNVGGRWMCAHERAGADECSRQHDERGSSRNRGESLEKKDAAQARHKPRKHGCCDGVGRLRGVERRRREQDDGPDACAGIAYGEANMPRRQPRYARIYQWSPSRTCSPYYRTTSTSPRRSNHHG